MLGTRGMLAAVGLATVLVGGGCGASGAAPRAERSAPTTTTKPTTTVVRNPALQSRLLRSVTLTTAAGTARTSISVTITGLGDDALSSGAFDIAGTGVVDLASGDARLSLSVPLFDEMSGGGTIEERIVRGIVYTKMPSAILRVAGLPKSVRWLSLDPRRAHVTGGSALSQSQADPAGQLSFLQAASEDVRRIGSEPVRGVPSTRYAATIDLAASARPSRRVDAVREELTQLGAAIDARRLTLDVWLDRDGRIRRSVISVPLSRPARAAATDGLPPGATMRVQADFFSFGTPMRVGAPPAAQVRPYSSVKLVPLGRG